MNTYPIRKIPANTSGKDYVVGDLHGCYDLLEKLLEAVAFDKSKDRLFSVGDLIDRGPDSLRCLELLFEPWFYAVQGNHEMMMVDFLMPYLNQGYLEQLENLRSNGFLEFGGNWIKTYFEPENKRMTEPFHRCLLAVLNLPLILVIGENESRFNVIHAELVKPDFKQTSDVVWLDNDIDSWLVENKIPPEVEYRLYWGRTLMMNIGKTLGSQKYQEGLSTTFCGHTFAHTPRHLLSHINIDTGAFMPLTNSEVDIDGIYSLTIYDVKESKWLATSYQRDEVVESMCVY